MRHLESDTSTKAAAMAWAWQEAERRRGEKGVAGREEQEIALSVSVFGHNKGEHVNSWA